LFELRLKAAEGIARILYCTLVGRGIIILHLFVKARGCIPGRFRWAERV
jgi:phage-related protein